MVIKGNARGSPAGLAKHLLNRETNERAEVRELRGVAGRDLAEALLEMDALGAGLRTERTLYHASINIRADETLTRAQQMHAIDRLEAALGLTGQPRAIVEHEKHGRAGEGRVHWHVVWSRTDLEHQRAIRCDHNFRTHELVARALEREFGHARVQGAHVERDGPDGERIARPARTPSHAEMQQAGRSGIDPQAMKAEITALWQATDSGKAFAAALEEKGYTLARGDRRDFVILDRDGGVHSLARRIEGATAKDVRTRMADLDREQLPTVTQAREAQQAREHAPAERAAENRAPPAWQPDHEITPAHPAHDPHTGVRGAGDIIGRGVEGVIGKMLDGLASVFESLFERPRPPPTREEQQRAEQAAQEREATRQQEAAKAADGDRLLREQQDIQARLEEQLKADLERWRQGRDDDISRGRER